MSHQQNITRIRAVYNALGDLKDEVVFVGGATVSLYADREATDVRPTDDVDILVEVSSQWEYSEIEQRLRERGFQNYTSARFIGRYKLPGIIVDVMPTAGNILGFSNKWYTEGFTTSISYALDELYTVRIFTASIFIASKLEAFKNRGNNDGRTSSDFEDIVFVLENRSSIWEEMQSSQPELRKYLHNEFSALFKNPDCREWLTANSNTYPPSSFYIMKEMEDFVSK